MAFENDFTATHRRSVVQVHFADHDLDLAYYNDQFDLRRGDLVYVDGKMEGIRGRVTDINYNFKIKLSDYKRVIAVVDTGVSGQFYMAGSHFVTFYRPALPPDKAIPWFLSPDKEEDEIVSGGDETSFPLSDLAKMKVSAGSEKYGIDYYRDNKVKYLCLDGTHGYAIVEGNRPYEVTFEYFTDEIRNLTCSCYCVQNCKHMVAVMLELKDQLDRIKKQYATQYAESGYFAAVSKATLFEFAVGWKEEGRITF